MCCWLLLLTGCHINVKITEQKTPAAAVDHPAAAFLAAYNQADMAAILELVSDDVRYMFIDGNQFTTETNNKTELKQFLVSYFKNQPHAQSQLISSERQGPFVHQLEQAFWSDQTGQARSQCSLSIYEIRQQLIVNIWYFTAFECPES